MGCHPSHWRTHIFQRGWNHQPVYIWVSFHCHVWLPETISFPNQNGPLPCFRNLHCSVERPEYHTWHSHSKKFHKETTRELGYHLVSKHPYDPCMLYMVTFTINIPQMFAYIPYMDPMGNCDVQIFSGFAHEILATFFEHPPETVNFYICIRTQDVWPILTHWMGWIFDPGCFGIYFPHVFPRHAFP